MPDLFQLPPNSVGSLRIVACRRMRPEEAAIEGWVLDDTHPNTVIELSDGSIIYGVRTSDAPWGLLGQDQSGEFPRGFDLVPDEDEERD